MSAAAPLALMPVRRFTPCTVKAESKILPNRVQLGQMYVATIGSDVCCNLVATSNIDGDCFARYGIHIIVSLNTLPHH